MNSKKTIIIIILLLTVTILNTNIQKNAEQVSTEQTEQTETHIYYNDEKIIIENTEFKHYNELGRLMIPLRAFADIIDIDVYWNSIEKSIEVSKGDIRVSYDTLYPRLLKDNTYYKLGVLPEIQEDEIYVELVTLAESLNISVTITTNGEYETYKISDSEKQIEITENIKGFNKLLDVMDDPLILRGILLVNKSHGLPEGYSPGQEVLDEVQYAFEVLKQDAEQEDLNIYISSWVRDYARQQEIYSNFVSNQGQDLAETKVARPGHSEHQTGLALDVNTIDSSFGGTPESNWLELNGHKYGFIIRYPKGKESITGFQYEPWHIRYVGVNHATRIFESGLSLEEYLDVGSNYEQ